MKDVFAFLIGFALGICSLFLLVTRIDLVSDQINIISIIVNVGIVVSAAYFLQDRMTNNRYIKEYFINQLETTRSDYDLFLKNIRNNKLNRKEIVKEFKYFSIKITDLDNSLTTKIKLKQVNLQSKNRSIHMLITNSNEFNSTTTNAKVNLGINTLNQLLNSQSEIGVMITDIVFLVNSK